MKNYKFTCSYDGSRYKGWQRLGDGQITIQETIETVIARILDYEVAIHGSGRTDAGVHAKGQVFHMKLPFVLQDDFLSQLNQKLPEDICVVDMKTVCGDFHARHDAITKTYEYFVDTTDRPSVFERKYNYHFPYQLDLAAMKNATIHLTGEHDFSSFTDDRAQEKDKVRVVYEIHITEKAGKYIFQYRGNGFLQHMVRIMTGTLLEVGRGDKSPDDVLNILRAKERVQAGFLVPAKGLFLKEVEYN